MPSALIEPCVTTKLAHEEICNRREVLLHRFEVCCNGDASGGRVSYVLLP